MFDLVTHAGKPFHSTAERDKMLKVMLDCLATIPAKKMVTATHNTTPSPLRYNFGQKVNSLNVVLQLRKGGKG